MDGRETQQLLGTLERIAVANEELIRLATEERNIEFKPTPPFCPHCQSLNPRVTSEGGGGLMSEFVLVARCETCGRAIYGVPDGWQVYGSKEEARSAIQGGGNE